MPAHPLPDPQWTFADAVCVACGYSLHGLAPEGTCPECGSPYSAHQLVICGVPSTLSGGRTWRRVVWIALIIVAVALSQSWPFLLLIAGSFARWAALLAFVTLVLGIVAMLATSRRERHGAERFIITPSGIAQLPLKPTAEGAAHDAVFTAWGVANAVELKRVSSVWRRMRVGVVAQAGGRMTPIFIAGVRCPDDAAEEVTRYLLAMIHKQPIAYPGDQRAIGLTPPTSPPAGSLRTTPPTTPPTAD